MQYHFVGVALPNGWAWQYLCMGRTISLCRCAWYGCDSCAVWVHMHGCWSTPQGELGVHGRTHLKVWTKHPIFNSAAIIYQTWIVLLAVFHCSNICSFNSICYLLYIWWFCTIKSPWSCTGWMISLFPCKYRIKTIPLHLVAIAAQFLRSWCVCMYHACLYIGWVANITSARATYPGRQKILLMILITQQWNEASTNLQHSQN